MKKSQLVRFFLSVFAVFLMFCASAKAGENDRSYGKYFVWKDTRGVEWSCYQYKTHEAVIEGCREATMELAVPERVYDENGVGYKVTGLISHGYDGFFYHGKNPEYMLVRLDLPDTVEFIGERAFCSYNYAALQVVNLPQNPLLTIEEYAFRGCNKLVTVRFTAKVGIPQPVRIEANAFQDCISLKSITFPDKSIVDGEAFTGCFGLEELINYPESYLNLGGEVNNTREPALKKIIYAEGLTEIYGVSWNDWKPNADGTYTSDGGGFRFLAEIGIPSTAKVIGGFAECPALTRVELPNGLEKIGMGAFADCTSLSSINFPASLKKIEREAFQGCTNLRVSVNHPGALYYQYYNSGIKDITITFAPAEPIRELYPSSLLGCPNLESINVVNPGDGFMTRDGVLYTAVYAKDYTTKIGWCLAKYPAGKSNGGSYTIPSDVCLIGAFAFDSCNFSEIHIPVTVRGLAGETAYTIDPDRTFYPFDGMASRPTVYYVPNSFADDDLLRTLPVNLMTENGPDVKITYKLDGGTNAAENPSSIPGGTSVLLKNPSKNGYDFLGWKKESGSGYLKDGLLKPMNEELVNGMTVVACWQRKDTSGENGGNEVADDIKVGDTFTVGGIKVRVLKYGRETGNSVMVIGPKDKNAAAVTIPATVKIRRKSFKVSRIGKKAFRKMKKLKTLSIGSNVNLIMDYAFADCTKLTKLSFAKKSSLNKIGKGAFSGCKALVSLTIPNSVSDIEADAFSKCTALEKAAIGTGIKRIGAGAFSGDGKLSKITIKSKKLKKVGKNALKNIRKKATVKVPADKWKEYQKLFEKKGQTVIVEK